MIMVPRPAKRSRSAGVFSRYDAKSPPNWRDFFYYSYGICLRKPPARSGLRGSRSQSDHSRTGRAGLEGKGAAIRVRQGDHVCGIALPLDLISLSVPESHRNLRNPLTGCHKFLGCRFVVNIQYHHVVECQLLVGQAVGQGCKLFGLAHIGHVRVVGEAQVFSAGRGRSPSGCRSPPNNVQRPVFRVAQRPEPGRLKNMLLRFWTVFRPRLVA